MPVVRLGDIDQLKENIKSTSCKLSEVDYRLAELNQLVMREPTDYEKRKMIEVLGDWTYTTTVTTTNTLPCCDTIVAGRLPDIEHKLKPMICENCGGRIDKDTMTCCYCGTFYQ